MSASSETTDLAGLRISRDTKDPESAKGARLKLLGAALTLLVLGGGYILLRGALAPIPEVEVAAANLTFPSQANAVLTASGYVVAQQKAAVASKGTGRLEYLGVVEGDKVKKGQIIGRLEDRDVAAALEKARADLEVAKADSEDAARSLERTKELYSSALASRADLDAAEARFKQVQASIVSSKANVKGAEVALDNTLILAPFDGTVLTKDANVGEVVAPFGAATNSRGAVVTIADMSSLEVEADVSESNITRVKSGQPTDIVLDAYPEIRYQGYVTKIVPTADRAKATVLTKVRFKARDERVLPEMSAKVTFLSKEADSGSSNQTPVLTVPISSVVTRGGHETVLLVRDDMVSEVPVRVGMRVGDRIEIKEGLMEHDRVVLRPTPELTSSTKVKIKS